MKRVQRKRVKGWKMPEQTKYVGRPTKWGNPFTGDRAVEKYRQLVCSSPKRLAELKELEGFDLACWCNLDTKCHADVLIDLITSGYKFGD